MSGSFESVRQNACVHKLDLGLYSHPIFVREIGSEPMLVAREKFPLQETQNGQTRNAASRRTASPTPF